MSLPFSFGLQLYIRYLQFAATQTLPKISTSYSIYQWKYGQAKKENELPFNELCSANISCT